MKNKNAQNLRRLVTLRFVFKNRPVGAAYSAPAGAVSGGRLPSVYPGQEHPEGNEHIGVEVPGSREYTELGSEYILEDAPLAHQWGQAQRSGSLCGLWLLCPSPGRPASRPLPSPVGQSGSPHAGCLEHWQRTAVDRLKTQEGLKAAGKMAESPMALGANEGREMLASPTAST